MAWSQHLSISRLVEYGTLARQASVNAPSPISLKDCVAPERAIKNPRALSSCRGFSDSLTANAVRQRGKANRHLPQAVGTRISTGCEQVSKTCRRGSIPRMRAMRLVSRRPSDAGAPDGRRSPGQEKVTARVGAARQRLHPVCLLDIPVGPFATTSGA